MLRYGLWAIILGGLLGGVLCYLGCSSVPAHAQGAACWVLHRFTAPGDSSSYDGAIHPVARYEGKAMDVGSITYTVPLYADTTTGSGPPIPAAPGQPDHFWTRWALSNSRPTIFWLIAIGANGLRSDSSNADVLRLPVPADSATYDQTTNTWAMPRLFGGTPVAFFARAPGANLWNGGRPGHAPWTLVPIVATQSELQAADRPELCREFGYAVGQPPCGAAARARVRLGWDW